MMKEHLARALERKLEKTSTVETPPKWILLKAVVTVVVVTVVVRTCMEEGAHKFSKKKI